MNVKDASRADLEDTATVLLDEITRISHEWHNVLPKYKATLIEIENELYRREK